MASGAEHLQHAREYLDRAKEAPNLEIEERMLRFARAEANCATAAHLSALISVVNRLRRG